LIVGLRKLLSLVVVRGGVPSRPLTIPLSDLVVARLTDGTDALTIVAPDTLAFPVGRRVVVRGRIRRLRLGKGSTSVI